MQQLEIRHVPSSHPANQSPSNRQIYFGNFYLLHGLYGLLKSLIKQTFISRIS